MKKPGFLTRSQKQLRLLGQKTDYDKQNLADVGDRDIARCLLYESRACGAAWTRSVDTSRA